MWEEALEKLTTMLSINENEKLMLDPEASNEHNFLCFLGNFKNLQVALTTFELDNREILPHMEQAGILDADDIFERWIKRVAIEMNQMEQSILSNIM